MAKISIVLQQDSTIPTYRQIYNQISDMISTGKLPPGERLPTERELSIDIGTTRGTIKSAYTLLKNEGKITARQGSGSYVAQKNHDGAIHSARQSICQLLDMFPESTIGSNELLALFQEELKRRRFSNRVIRVAWIEGCIECLHMAEEQISNVENAQCTGIILNDLKRNPVQLSKDYDLIVTTDNHYEIVTRLLPHKWDILEKVTLDLGINSAIEIAQIKSGARVMELCNDQFFKNIMREQLQGFDNLRHVVCLTNADSDDAIKRQLKKSDVLIICKVYADYAKKNILQAIKRFEAGGGQIIYFEYKLDKGSLLHFKECVHHIMEEKSGLTESSLTPKPLAWESVL